MNLLFNGSWSLIFLFYFFFWWNFIPTRLQMSATWLYFVKLYTENYFGSYCIVHGLTELFFLWNLNYHVLFYFSIKLIWFLPFSLYISKYLSHRILQPISKLEILNFIRIFLIDRTLTCKTFSNWTRII